MMYRKNGFATVSATFQGGYFPTKFRELIIFKRIIACINPFLDSAAAIKTDKKCSANKEDCEKLEHYETAVGQESTQLNASKMKNLSLREKRKLKNVLVCEILHSCKCIVKKFTSFFNILLYFTRKKKLMLFMLLFCIYISVLSTLFTTYHIAIFFIKYIYIY